MAEAVGAASVPDHPVSVGVETGLRRRIIWTGVAVVQAAVVGCALSLIVRQLPIGQHAPESNNVFYRMFGLHEHVFFAALALFTCWALYSCVASRTGDARADMSFSNRQLALLGLLVIVTGWAGARLVLLDFPFSMDEYNVVFQSSLFASGKLVAPIPIEWRGVAPAITPYFVTYKPDDFVWVSSYLPVYAALRAMMLKLGAASLTNPVLSALSIVVVVHVARRIWPRDPGAAALAGLLLVSSSQFLAMAMTSYSMPAHLFLNLCWLALYLRDDKPGLAAAPWVGVLALGLHNPFPHALFVAPFLFRLLRSRRRGLLAYFCLVYAGGCAAWVSWLNYTFNRVNDRSLLDVFGLPTAEQVLTHIMSLSLIASWQTPVFVLGLGIALATWRRMSSLQRDLAAGVLLTCGFYLFFSTSQGHGWGYRYFHAVLGNAVLLAVFGLVAFREAFGPATARRAVLASLLLTLVIQLPVRFTQMRQFVRPFADAVTFLRARPEPAVMLRTAATWYGQDLVRNDPFLTPPVIISSSSLRVSAIHWAGLRDRLGDSLRVVRPQELERFGLPIVRTDR